jgi:hypothetical protein
MEMMLVLSMAGLFMAGVYETVITGLRVANAADEREQIRQGLANTLERMTRVVTHCRNIDTATNSVFQCDIDTDGDGASSASTPYERNHVYTYDAAADTLTYDYNNSPSPSAETLARYVTAFDFNYLESGSSTEATTCDATSSCGGQCCRSELRVLIAAATATRDTETINVTTSIYLENM